MISRRFKNHQSTFSHTDQICDYCLETIEKGTYYCTKYRVYDPLLDERRHVHLKPICVHNECEKASLLFSDKDWMAVYSGEFQRPDGGVLG